MTRNAAGDAYTLTVRLLACDSGKELFGSQTGFTIDRMIPMIDELSKKLAVAARKRSDIGTGQIDAFIRAGDWDNAQKFLELYVSANPGEAERLSSDASAYREAGQYAKALSSIDNALALLPDDPKYTRIREEILAAERRESGARQMLSAYSDEIRNLDYGDLLLMAKKPASGFSAGLSSFLLINTEASGAAWLESEHGPFIALTGSYQNTFWEPLTLPISFMSFQVAWFASLRFGFGVQRSQDNGTLVSESPLLAGLAGGVQTRLTCLSFFLGFHAELGAAWIGMKRKSSAQRWQWRPFLRKRIRMRAP